MPIIEDKSFDKIDFTQSPIEKGEYENCRFTNCNFNEVDMSGIVFIDCVFEECNLSNANLNTTALRDVSFKNSKMLGLRFDHCNPFLLSMTFENCSLQMSVFYQVKIKKTTFRNCNLQEVDFSEADLEQCKFDDCDFLNAIFDNTILEKADLRNSFNISLDPEKNYIRKAHFSSNNVLGLLNKYDISIE